MSAESAATWDLDGHQVRITHPDRVYWPESGITKGDLLDYYRSMGPVMLPHFVDRPVTARVFPEGISGPSFYRRNRPRTAPEWLVGVEYETETDHHTLTVPVIDGTAGLIWFANQGGIEFHLWASRRPRLSEPDLVVFDLDPGEDTPFDAVLQAALDLRSLLVELGVSSHPKTSGGSGLHVYVGVAAGPGFEATRGWVRDVAGVLEERTSGRVAVAHGSTHRGTAVTVDHAQNSIGRNTAAPYTVRARPGAPVSTPLEWAEVEAGGFVPGDFTLRDVPDRVRERGDVFAPVLNDRNELPPVR